MEMHSKLAVKLDGTESVRLTEVLKTEVSQGHAMHPFLHDARALARIQGRDDVVFATGDCRHPYALVHLTWSGQQIPPFPVTTFCKDMRDLNTEMSECLGL